MALERRDLINGLLMPTFKDFLEATQEAVVLMPQEGDYFYLAGKGWGTEIALQGEVDGRVKRLGSIPARSHSDFELYGTKDDFRYTDDFYDRFGAQEVYPRSRTKGLFELPDDLLRRTAEKAKLPCADGTIEVLLPQLELLFLDKWMKRETTPRPIDGVPVCDAECLAATYDLNAPLLHTYLERHVIGPEKKNLEEAKARCRKNQVNAVVKTLKQIWLASQEEDRKTLSEKELAQALNEKMRQFSSALYNGIAGLAFVPLRPDDIVASGKGLGVTDDYAARATTSIEEAFEQKKRVTDSLHKELDLSLAGARALRQKLSAPTPSAFPTATSLRPDLVRARNPIGKTPDGL